MKPSIADKQYTAEDMLEAYKQGLERGLRCMAEMCAEKIQDLQCNSLDTCVKQLMAHYEPAPAPQQKTTGAEKCTRCNGTGEWRADGICYGCGGTGKRRPINENGSLD